VRPLDERPSDVVPVDVAALLDEVIGGLRPLLRNHRMVVEGGIRRFALADPPRLRQVVEHLVENAVKYAPPGTTITVTTALVEGTVRVGVSDEGPGIPPEWRERVFEPYARRETHTARGSGIGLFAAKRLSESMSAHLWCEPADPSGARFVIALPAAVAV
jgi:signal transduction histidine kinase